MQLKKNALSRRVSGLIGGGGAERNQRRVDGSSTDFNLGFHRLAGAADSGGSADCVRDYISSICL